MQVTPLPASVQQIKIYLPPPSSAAAAAFFLNLWHTGRGQGLKR
jgi:hypothetical protein